jgi:hypothetical protein
VPCEEPGRPVCLPAKLRDTLPHAELGPCCHAEERKQQSPLNRPAEELDLFQAAMPGFVAMLFEVLHERRASGADGVRVL